MKHFYLFAASILFICSCTSEEEISKKDSVLLLKIDYQTLEFEGGFQQKVSNLLPEIDTIPLSMDYKAPGDFGSIALYHKPGNELLFSGTIVWAGEGAISHPASFKPADDYPIADAAAVFPGIEQIKILKGGYHFNVQPDLKPVWNAVAKLRIVSEYRKAGKRINVLLYTPGVGAGDPAKWDWLLIMSK